MIYIRSMLLGAIMLTLSANIAAADKLAVVASFSILGDLVSTIGGDRVTVATLVGPDADAHIFEPTPNDAKTVVRARLVVVNGLGFEGWLERLISAANYKGEILIASKGIRPLHMPDKDNSAKLRTDPHAWQDPTNIITYVNNIVIALSKQDPEGAAAYRKNAAQYLQSLNALDAWASQQFAKIPPAKRKVITSHDAFEYFGVHYGILFFAPQGLSTESEPSAKDMAKLIRQIRQERTRAVYVENMTSPKLLEQLSREAGVSLGPKLYADALSSPQGKAPTYLKMVRYNVEQLMLGLQQN